MPKTIKLDILAFGAHPDDIELSCAGTLMKHIDLGYKVGIIDLTRGELGSRGSAALRLQEAKAASKVMGVKVRENLGFADGFFENDARHQLEIIRCLRKYRPNVVLANALSDRHPDHGRGARLVADAMFKSGLRKIVTLNEQAEEQEFWRPEVLLHYMQDELFIPDLLVDISDYIERKKKAILAYGSQFYNPKYKSDEPETYISDKSFFDRLFNRSSDIGRQAGYTYAEGFKKVRVLGVPDLMKLD